MQLASSSPAPPLSSVQFQATVASSRLQSGALACGAAVGAVISTVIVNCALTAPNRFSAVMVNENEPAWVGLPDSTPAGLSASPGGRLPPVKDNVPLGVPVPEVNA